MSLIARNTILLTIAKFFSVAIYSIFGLLLARYVPTAQNGVYSLMNSLLFFGSLASSFGIPLVVMRSVARAPARAAQVYADGRKAMCVGAAISWVAIYLYLAYESWDFGAFEPQKFLLAGLVCAIILCDAFGSLGEGVFQGLERMAAPAMVEIVSGVVRAGGALLALILTPVEYRLYAVWTLFLVGAAVRSVVISRLLHRRVFAAGPLPTSSLRRGLAIAVESGPIGLFRMMRMLRNRIDVLLIGTLIVMPVSAAVEAWNPDVARGLYAQAVRVVIIFHTLTLAFTTAIFPRILRETEGSERMEEAFTSYRTAVSWQAWWAAPLAAGLFYYADTVCGWFGAQYRDGIPELGLTASTADVLRLLLIAVFLDCVGGPVGAVMMGMRTMERRMPLIGGIIAGTSILLNVILIPRYGILGAAWASIGAAVVEFVLKLLLVSQIFGRPAALLTSIAPHALLAGAMIGLLALLGLGNQAILGGLLGAAVYGLASVALGLTHPAIVAKVRGLLRR